MSEDISREVSQVEKYRKIDYGGLGVEVKITRRKE